MSDIEKEENRTASNTTKVAVFLNTNQDSNEEHPDISALKSLFKTTLETRNFEISMLVQRNNFFMIFQGVLFAGLIQSSHTKPIVSFMVCFVGFIVSAFQAGMAAGAKFWQEYWEQALHEVEKELLKFINQKNNPRRITFELFHDQIDIYEKMVKDRLECHGYSLINKLILKRYSVSRVPIYVAIILAAIWLILILCTMRAYAPLGIPSFIVGF